eukprot:14212240-Alexandrium_andersonii.AAC.1
MKWDAASKRFVPETDPDAEVDSAKGLIVTEWWLEPKREFLNKDDVEMSVYVPKGKRKDPDNSSIGCAAAWSAARSGATTRQRGGRRGAQ